MRLCPFLHRIGRHTVLANRDLSSRLMLPQSAIFNGEGELSAAIELRRRFPGIGDNTKARACARTIAGWTPLPKQMSTVTRPHRPKDT